MADDNDRAGRDPPGGGFKPAHTHAKGGPDYGRFIDTVPRSADHARARHDAPDAVVTRAAALIEEACSLLAPTTSTNGPRRRAGAMTSSMRGNILSIPNQVDPCEDGRLRGWARFRRVHLGRNGAVHGGIIAHLFDSVLGKTRRSCSPAVPTSAPPICT